MVDYFKIPIDGVTSGFLLKFETSDYVESNWFVEVKLLK